MFPSLGPGEMMMVMLVAVLLFGKRLPEVGRSLGKGIVEFKKGIRGIEDEFESASSGVPSRRPEPVREAPPHDDVSRKFGPRKSTRSGTCPPRRAGVVKAKILSCFVS